MPQMKFRDIASLKGKLSIALITSLIEFLGIPVHHKELSGTIQVTELEPRGYVVDIHYRIQLVPKNEVEIERDRERAVHKAMDDKPR